MPTPTSDPLHALGLHAHEAGLVALLPLIEVAWADGVVQPAEKRMILQTAESRFDLDDHGRDVLEGWLSWRPSHTTLALGRQALAELAGRGELPADLPELALGVARAAGGVLGLGAVDARERAVVEQLEDVIARGHHEAVTVQDVDDEDDEPDTDVGPSPLVDALAWTEPQGEQDTATLVVASGAQSTLHALSGEVVRVGRSRSCPVKIGADSRVSREHCRLVCRNGAWFVEDLGSANGTWVNGDRVSARRLLGGEEIRVGSTFLRYVARGEQGG